ncbi:MAG: cytochrome b [Gammaproteobacteria bacterium]
MLINSADRYGLVSRLLHWLMALLILAMIGIGAYMTDLDKEDPLRTQFYTMHKEIGVTILALALLRILWILASRPPVLPAALQRWEVILARSTTGLLYLLMLATPIAGFLMTNASGKPVSYFGLFDLPLLIRENQDLHEILEEVHIYLAFTILALVALHALGAIKHRFIDKDPEADVLKRMI